MLVVPAFFATEIALRHLIRRRYGLGPPTILDMWSGEPMTEAMMRDAIERSMAEGAPRPLRCSQDAIDNLPTITLNEVDADDNANTCAVCLEDFAAAAQVCRLPCSHQFHKACVEMWLQHCNTCPSCRKPVPDDNPPDASWGSPLFLSDQWFWQNWTANSATDSASLAASAASFFASWQPLSRPAVAIEPEPVPEPLDVNFTAGPIGIVYEGRQITEVRSASQAEQGGVTVGMRIVEIGGWPAADDSRAIKERLVHLKSDAAPFTMRFA